MKVFDSPGERLRAPTLGEFYPIVDRAHGLRQGGGSRVDLPGVQACWTLADARAIVARADQELAGV